MLESKTQRSEIFFWTLVLLVCAAVAWFGLQLYNQKPHGGNQYVLIFDNAVGLKPNAPVAVSGVDIGLVENIELEDNKAKINIIISKSARIYSNAFAEIRARSLLGEKFISLNPGNKNFGVLKNNSQISNNPEPIDVDGVILEVGSLLAKTNRLINKYGSKFENLENIDLNKYLAKYLDPVLSLVNKANNFDLDNYKNFTNILAKLESLLDKANSINEADIRDMLQIDGLKVRLWSSSKAEEIVKKKYEKK